MIQKAAVGVLIGLSTRIIVVKIVVVESLIVEVIDIDWNNMHKEMALIKHGIKDY